MKAAAAEAFVFAFVIWASCILSSPCNEWRGYTLQPKDKKLTFKEYFKPVNYARSTGIGATIMGISLFIGRLVTPYAEKAFAFMEVHPAAGVVAVAAFVALFKVISSPRPQRRACSSLQQGERRRRSLRRRRRSLCRDGI